MANDIFNSGSIKKITYVIEQSPFYKPLEWEHSPKVELLVSKINGQPVVDDTKRLVAFPNPEAGYMVRERDLLIRSIGEELATTVIDYLDKETNLPVLTVFPTVVRLREPYKTSNVCRVLDRLNYDSYQDFRNQVKMRRLALDVSTYIRDIAIFVNTIAVYARENEGRR